MKNKPKELAKSVLLLALTFIVFIPIVSAQSTSPSSATYWGVATLDGETAPTGTFITVEVKDTGEVVGRSTVVDVPNTYNWSYGLSIEFEAPEIMDPENGKAHSGDNLIWKVGGIVCSVPEIGSDIALPGVEKRDFNLVASTLELSTIGSRSVSEGNELLISLSATKAEDFDSLTYPINATLAVFTDDVLFWDHFFTFIPDDNKDFNSFTFSTNATFGELNGNVFNWTTSYTDAGVYPVEFSVSDGKGGVDSEVVELTVINVNRAPVLTEFSPQVVAENDELVIELLATDEDGDSLTFSWNDSSIGNLDGNMFTWKPGYEDSGTYFVEFTVSDGEFEDSEVVEITVEDARIAPLKIESVSLYPANTIQGSSINIEVVVTGGTELTGVSANDVLLKEINSVWQGNVTASSTIGEHIILVIASDTAGNTAETSIHYNVLSLEGDADISVTPRENNIKAGDLGIINIKIKNNQNIDDIFKIRINLDELPESSLAGLADLSWFEWTEKEIRVKAGEKMVLTVEVEVPEGTAPGYKLFRINMDSEISPIYGYDTGYLIILEELDFE